MSRSKNKARQGSGEKSQRQLRVGELVRHALTQILERGVVRDPDLAGVAITVSEIRVSSDLRNATAYVMPLGGDDCEIVVEALRRAAPFLRRNLAARLDLRYVPNLLFEADATFDYAGRINQLLNDRGDSSDNPPADDDGA
ncbi:MAG: 30S ribosome-binding factor RbfA [Rhodospirillales bacterium]|nr:30S ribosome-binding factor RbfA [Rhodospirillales bacterium]